MKTQYELILSALRRAGRKGCTTRELMLQCGTNWPHKRISEMTTWYGNAVRPEYGGRQDEHTNLLDVIDKSERLVNGRRVRVYRLVRLTCL